MTEYNLDGTGWQTYTGPIPVTGEGKHRLLYRSVDHAQNQEADKLLVLRFDRNSEWHQEPPAEH